MVKGFPASIVAKLLKRGGISAAQAARVCGVSRQSIHNWTTGKHVPEWGYVAALVAECNKRGRPVDLVRALRETI